MCKYHGTINLKAMKWITRTLFLISTLHSLNFPSVTAAFDDVETFPIQAKGNVNFLIKILKTKDRV